jgi:hypothetical protein
MTSRCTLTALVGAFLVSAHTPADANCRVIDTTGEFWPLVERLAEATPAEQPAAFRTNVIAKFPELYTRDVLASATISVTVSPSGVRCGRRGWRRTYQ